MTSSRQNPPARWLIAVLVAAVLVAAFAVYSANAGAAPANPTVRLSVPRQARVGEPIVVEIVAENVRNVAGYQADIGFDDGIEYVAGGVAEGLRRNGRDVLPFGPFERDGTVTIGAASCPARGCNVPNPRKAGKIGNGVGGSFVLGRLEFAAKTTGQLALELRNVKLLDPKGNLIAVAAQGANLTVGR